MKIYKNRQFKRWQNKNKIADTVIIKEFVHLAELLKLEEIIEVLNNE